MLLLARLHMTAPMDSRQTSTTPSFRAIFFCMTKLAILEVNLKSDPKNQGNLKMRMNQKNRLIDIVLRPI